MSCLDQPREALEIVPVDIRSRAETQSAAGPRRNAEAVYRRYRERFGFIARLKKGKPVTFALTTSDFVHGFNVPDFNVRADLIPGKTVEVTFTPDRAGRFAFLCDNFCGEGHDRMSGFLVVSAE